MIFSNYYLQAAEDAFDAEQQYVWFVNYWWVSIVLCVIYFVVIYGIQAWMKSRPKYSLRVPLTVWSTFLAIFAIMGAVITTPEIFEQISNEGLHSSVCDIGSMFEGRVGFWMWLYIHSKGFEFGDTIFIVLRKQNLTFLHWYHHMITIIYSYHSYRYQMASVRYLIPANFIVHSFMYSYYALRATGLVKMPRVIKPTITSVQMLQMVIGIVVSVYAIIQFGLGNDCAITHTSAWFSLIVYGMFLILFLELFYNSYIKVPEKVKSK